MGAPTTLTFVDPQTVVTQLSIKPGAKIADFGCGSGYFSFEFAKHAGNEGLVYALDVLPSALEAVASRAKILGLNNVITKRVNLERENGSGLPVASVDWVVMKDVLIQNEKKEIMMREVVRILKPGGQALIMEWNPKEASVGPDAHHRLDPEVAKKLITGAGLTVDKELNVGGYHYAFLVRK